MKSTTAAFLAIGMGHLAAVEIGQERWKKEILERWDQSKKMPRKKKKRVRKELILEWSIANWNIFENL